MPLVDQYTKKKRKFPHRSKREKRIWRKNYKTPDRAIQLDWQIFLHKIRKGLKQKSERFEQTLKQSPSMFCFLSSNSDGVEQIKEACISTHNSKHKNKEILLLIKDVKNSIILLWKACLDYYIELPQTIMMTGYRMNCLHSFRTQSKLKSYENVCKDQGFCKINAWDT